MYDETPPTDQHPALRVVPMPADANAAGDIFGGWIMAQADLAGGVVAARRAQGRVVTVAVNALQFKKPVYVGDVVSFYAEVIAVGHTSITVDVMVFAERGLLNANVTDGIVKVTEATLTYVAVDRAGGKRPVPAL
jgi:acyl-CoA thioesterase YciA